MRSGPGLGVRRRKSAPISHRRVGSQRPSSRGSCAGRALEMRRRCPWPRRYCAGLLHAKRSRWGANVFRDLAHFARVSRRRSKSDGFEVSPLGRATFPTLRTCVTRVVAELVSRELYCATDVVNRQPDAPRFDVGSRFPERVRGLILFSLSSQRPGRPLRFPPPVSGSSCRIRHDEPDTGGGVWEAAGVATA